MFDRLKAALVKSFVGAVGLGYMMATVVSHFVNVFAAPIGAIVSRNTYREVTQQRALTFGEAMSFAWPEIVRFVVLLMVWSVLLRWLYFDSAAAPVDRTNCQPS